MIENITAAILGLITLAAIHHLSTRDINNTPQARDYDHHNTTNSNQ